MVERQPEGAELLLVPAGAERDTSRPPLSSSTAAAARARSAGGRNAVQATSGPSSTRSVTAAIAGEHRPAVPRAALGTPVAAVEQVVADPERVEAGLLGSDAPAHASSGQRTSRSTSGSWTPTFIAQNASNAGGSVGIAVIRCQTPSRWSISEHLVDVELAAEPLPARAVDGDRVLVVGERPAQLAQVRAVGEAARLAEELEDARAALVHAARRARCR